MLTLRRLTVPGLNAFFVTGALLYIMFLLIKTDDPELVTTPVINLPPITATAKETEPEPIVVKPLQPLEVTLAPTIPDLKPVMDLGEIEGLKLGEPTILRQHKGLPTPLNNQLILALGYPPNYPRDAITQEIEGYAVVGFSVSAAGSVYEPFIIESQPGSVFDRASLKAITKFKYQAQMVNGKPVAVSGQRYMFTYKLGE